MLAIALGERRDLDVLTKSRILKSFKNIPEQIRTITSNIKTIQDIAQELSSYDHCFFLGRYYQAPIALE